MRKTGSNSRDECLSKSDCPQKGLENAAGPPPLRIQTRISEEGGREKIPSGAWGRSPSSLSPNGPATLTLMPSPLHPLKVLVRNRVGTHLHFGRTPDHLLWKWPVPGGPTTIPHCQSYIGPFLFGPFNRSCHWVPFVWHLGRRRRHRRGPCVGGVCHAWPDFSTPAHTNCRSADRDGTPQNREAASWSPWE